MTRSAAPMMKSEYFSHSFLSCSRRTSSSTSSNNSDTYQKSHARAKRQAAVPRSEPFPSGRAISYRYGAGKAKLAADQRVNRRKSARHRLSADRLSRSRRLAQLPLHHLAVGIARQRLGGERDRFRHLVVGQPLRAPGAQRLGGDGVARHHHRMHALAEHRAGLRDDRTFDHAGMAREHRFDLGGIDLETAAVDHVLLAIEHAHEIVGVDRADVAGMPEAAGEG